MFLRLRGLLGRIWSRKPKVRQPVLEAVPQDIMVGHPPKLENLVASLEANDLEEMKNKKKLRSACYVEDGQLISLGKPFTLDLITDGPPRMCRITAEQAKFYYKQLVTIKEMEDVSTKILRQNEMRSNRETFGHLEGCAVGITAAMRKRDKLVSASDCHIWSFLLGMSPYSIMAELSGRSSGCHHGKAGMKYMTSPNFIGGRSLFRSQIALATGVATAMRYREEGCVCIVCYQDQCVQSQAHSSFRISEKWKLPIIYVSIKTQDNARVYKRYAPTISSDGTSILAVRTAMDFCIDYVNRNGPIFVELLLNDAQAPWLAINKFRNLCMCYGILAEEDFKCIEETATKMIDNSVRRANADGPAKLGQLASDVYAELLPQILRRRTEIPADGRMPAKACVQVS